MTIFPNLARIVLTDLSICDTLSPMPEPTYLSAVQVAHLIKKSPGTVKRFTREGKLPHAFKMPGASGAYVYNVADVVAWASATGIEVAA